MALTLSALQLEKNERLAANAANRAFSKKEDRSLESSPEAFRRYRAKDPEFKLAIASFVDAEASLEDPLEGRCG